MLDRSHEGHGVEADALVALSFGKLAHLLGQLPADLLPASGRAHMQSL